MTGGCGSLATEQIDAEALSSSWSVGAERGEGNPHRSIPDFVSAIDASTDLDAGVPLPGVVIALLIEIDVEVDPFALWGRARTLYNAGCSGSRSR